MVLQKDAKELDLVSILALAEAEGEDGAFHYKSEPRELHSSQLVIASGILKYGWLGRAILYVVLNPIGKLLRSRKVVWGLRERPDSVE